MKDARVGTAILLLFLTSLGTEAALADDEDDQGIHQTCSRVSFVSGEVSFSRGDDPDAWQPAELNVPMTLGDRVYAGRDGRLELQISGGNYARIAPGTDLMALNMTEETKQFSINEGLASFQIRRFDEDEILEVDTPNAAVTFERPGEYRVEVDTDGNTRVGVLRGRATVSAGGGEMSLNAGEEMDVYGVDDPQYDIVGIAPPDPFDAWVAQRERRLEHVASYRYVSPAVVGVEDLDEHGRWVPLPGYGVVWTPTVVSAGWSPYSQGHWVWQDPWGWTWIAVEPWGWAPYHYGRWFQYSSRWYWSPVRPSVQRVAYAPALVAFVGGSGGGASLSVSIGTGGAIGWFPLAPADPLIPWWGERRQVNVTNVNVTNVKYVNKTYVTVVNQNTFVSGGLVQNNVVRDQRIIRQVGAAPIAGGTLPVPTRASLRVSARGAPAPAPPPGHSRRAVVARIAPPPEPPRFEKKLRVIEESRGAPVAPQVATRLATEDQEAPRARLAVRAVADEEGRVRLKPRGKGHAGRPGQPNQPGQPDQPGQPYQPGRPAQAEAPGQLGPSGQTQRAPMPVRPVRGRPMATPDRPVQPQQVTGETPPPAGPTGEVRAPAEGREGRWVSPGHSRDRSRPSAQTPPPQPPPNAPNRTPGAGANRPQPPSQQQQPKKKQETEEHKKNKKKKNQQEQDPNAPSR